MRKVSDFADQNFVLATQYGEMSHGKVHEVESEEEFEVSEVWLHMQLI